jgi:hypothetical protein
MRTQLAPVRGVQRLFQKRTEMAGSTSFQSWLAAATSSPISSLASFSALRFLKNSPLNFFTFWRIVAVKPPSSIAFHRSSIMPGKISGSCAQSFNRSLKQSFGRSYTSSANMVKSMRMRNMATSSAA